MPEIPREKSPDSTLALKSDPYGFISKRCREYRTDLFETRIMLRKTICMTGPDAAELFYDPDRFQRHGAQPHRVQKTLFGKGGVQALDGEAHRHRKEMFMGLMAPERIRELGELSAQEWRRNALTWNSSERIVLYDEGRRLLARAACQWSGVPLEEAEVDLRTEELTALFSYAGSVGPKHWWALLARNRANHWMESVIEKTRAGELKPPEQTAAYVIAHHRELNGEPLSPHDAAVDLLSVIRPTVAVSVFITFAAHALHEHPECRQKIRDDGEGYVRWFVQEVRRCYPFFPAVIARVRHDFEWRGYHFPRGTRVMLDLYGTDHDPRVWEAPEEFRPERFREDNEGAFKFIPQGGGNHHTGHRCPGEWITIELMTVAAKFLAGEITYDVPPQDLCIDYGKLPALVRSGFVMSGVRRVA